MIGLVVPWRIDMHQPCPIQQEASDRTADGLDRCVAHEV